MAYRTERSGFVAKAPKSALGDCIGFGVVPRPRVNWRIPHHASRSPRRHRNTTALCAWDLYRHTVHYLCISGRGLQCCAVELLLTTLLLSLLLVLSQPARVVFDKVFRQPPRPDRCLVLRQLLSHHIFAARLLASLITTFAYRLLAFPFACLLVCCWILSV
jgi:hypothetical protein